MRDLQGKQKAEPNSLNSSHIEARNSPIQGSSTSALATAAGLTNRVTRKMRLIRKQQLTDASETY